MRLLACFTQIRVDELETETSGTQRQSILKAFCDRPGITGADCDADAGFEAAISNCLLHGGERKGINQHSFAAPVNLHSTNIQGRITNRESPVLLQSSPLSDHLTGPLALCSNHAGLLSRVRDGLTSH